MAKKWPFSVDRGGTFTDVIGFSPDGKLHASKLLSYSPNYADSSLQGVQSLVNDLAEVASLRLGSTIATNTLLERKGAKTALLTTKGFADALQIGYQNRLDLFALNIQKEPVLFQSVKEVDERVDAQGEILQPLQREQVEKLLDELEQEDIVSVAVLLLHSWKNPEHEKSVAKWVRERGFTCVSSYESSGVIKFVTRGQTTVVDAYLAPVLGKYISDLKSQAQDIPLKFMQSSGGLTEEESFTGSKALLSGPAGGVIALSHLCQTLGLPKAIGFDMGGTSTDVSRIDEGKWEKIFETRVADIPLQTDMIHIHTVAAGGGSILKFETGRMQVGPESAGADPGPACYGRQGPLTVTDANLFLGRILPEYFPQSFGESGREPLDTNVVEEKFQHLVAEICAKSQQQISIPKAVEGFLQIANQNMSNAIKEISTAQGFRLEEFVLFSFGGAGAQHACALARTLNIPKIILHPLAGLLSAYGIALADIVKQQAQTVLQPLSPESWPTLEKQGEQLLVQLQQQAEKQHSTYQKLHRSLSLEIRPKGTESTLIVAWGSLEQVQNNFLQRYYQRYGVRLEKEKPLEVVNLRAEVVLEQEKCQEPKFELQRKRLGKEEAEKVEHQAYFAGKYHATPVYKRRNIQPGNYLIGPAIIIEEYSTIVVEPDFQAEMNEYRHIELTPIESLTKEVSTEKDPIMLEIFNNLFANVANQMGATLLNTAYSTNIKERLDFSCAVFDNEGKLVANAPHIPVHLGAMGETVRHVLAACADKWQPGDVYVSNNPFAGGSHLPDITVVSPVFNEKKQLLFVVANRGHHADVGGKTPGSMPPFSQSIEEEGILFDNFQLLQAGKWQEEKLLAILQEKPYPARNLKERFSDFQAQVAANQTGIKQLQKIMDLYGQQVVLAYMKHIRHNATEATQEVLGKFLEAQNSFAREFVDYLDGGEKIQVKFTIERGDNPPASHHATIDFTGSAPQTLGNLNAPQAITQAAVLYVLRSLIEEEIPLNEGCLEPIEIILPLHSILHPDPGRAVVGGNVETSQRVVDVLYGALEVVAASQGTMNNFTFGQEGEHGYGYYETICGGAGAGNGFAGADAVHTHMTNTRITDPEILEYRHPEIRLEEFSIRKDSGGKGKYCGGQGVVRKIRFLKKCHVAMLSQRRERAPYGLKGGQPGSKGENYLIDCEGQTHPLPGNFAQQIQPGEAILILTPGGGGYLKD